MPTISMFRGLKVFINWDDHNPPHFHAEYGGEEILVRIDMRSLLKEICHLGRKS